jgi:dCMP deaminase
MDQQDEIESKVASLALQNEDQCQDISTDVSNDQHLQGTISDKNWIQNDDWLRYEAVFATRDSTYHNPGPRTQGVLSWDEFFMAMTKLAAMRSKDPIRQVGAVIVDENQRVVSLGYNGMTFGIDDQHIAWGKGNPSMLHNKHTYVVHAELNAILNKNQASLHGCSIYVSLFPCNECAKAIIQSRIKEVVYLSSPNQDKDENIAAAFMFHEAGVVTRQFVPSMDHVRINLLS